MSVGERIATARAHRGLTQTELARRAGIAQTHLSRYEADKVGPRKLALAKLAGVLVVRLEWLETGTGPMEEYPDTPGEGLTIALDAEVANRLRLYCELNELSMEEALADILDFPLSAYSPEQIPTDPFELAELKAALRSPKPHALRRKALARHVRVLPPSSPKH